MRNILPLVLIGSVLGATAIGSADDFVIEPVPSSAHPAFRNHFAKYVDVMGVAVYATSNSGNNKVLHCARTLAQYLDNDEDGEADDPAVLARMVADGASMVMWRTFDDAEDSDFWEDVPDSIADSCQDLMAEETIPNWEAQQEFDASLEECFHLVNFVGLARVYPEVFQEQAGSDVADAMDINIANGYFHYDDPTCDYRCKIIEYTYWAMTSMLGAQDAPWRRQEIADEWELYSRALVQKRDPAIFAILDSGDHGLPRVLPDQVYDPQLSCTGDFDGTGNVDGGDLATLLALWNQNAPEYDLNGDRIINGADLALLLAVWGDCR